MATTLLTRLGRLWREERGATAVMFTVFLTGLIGLVGASVDMGALYTARAQLQNAADAAALAAANTMIGTDADNNAVAQTGMALANAQTYSASNQALGVNLQLKNPPGTDFTIGFWDNNTGDFDPARTGMGIVNPNDLTGVRVVVRRDNSANTPVSTFFAGIVGIRQVELSARSTAFLGWPGGVPEGTVDLPIAIMADALAGGGGPDCGKSLTFSSENTENSEWTTFFTSPANNPNVDSYITGDLQVPALQVGDDINVINGNLSNNTFAHLQARFEANAVGGQWPVTLPVVTPGPNSTVSTVSGFATFVITEVRGAPHKDVTGFLQCGMVIPNTGTGGGNYGSRATFSRLAR